MSFDCDKTALTILAMLAIRKRSQRNLAQAVDINRAVLNLFLNRKINLLPSDIEKILQELGIENLTPKLSAPVGAEV